MISKCNNCIHKKNCIDGSNFEKALKCIRYSEEPMTAKEYLSQVYKLDKQAEMIFQKADAMRKSLYGRGQNYESNGHSRNSSDSIAKAVAKVVDYEHKADEIIDRLVNKRIEIENTIKLVPDPIQREVLERRYLLYQSFTSRYNKKTGMREVGIDEKTGYCARQVYRYHDEGLREISKIIKNVSECH